MARIAVRLMSRLLEVSNPKLGLSSGAPSLCSPTPAWRCLCSAGQAQPHPHQSSEGLEEASPSSSTAPGTQENEGKENRVDEGKDADDDDGGGGVYVNRVTGEIGGPRGPEPTRYGDWERGGRCSDF